MPEKKQSEGEMTVQEAGHRGGETVKEKYGPEFYSEIGHKGGAKGGHTVQEQTKKYEEIKKEENQ